MNKHRKYVIVILGIVILIPFLLFKTVFSKTVTVVDADTGKRIAGATVRYRYSNWADGCGKPEALQTNDNGKTTPDRSFWVCAVDAVAPGYHINGVNHGFVKKIKLYKQLNNDIPIEFSKVFTVGTGMDVLSYIASYNNTDAPKDKSNDFVITDIESTVTILPDGNRSINGVTNPARIQFFGEGGIQPISGSKQISSAGEYYFDMENMRTAPDDGFKKEMDILPMKPYVARLRDGKHYIKFHMFASQNYNTKVDQVCITGFASSQPGKSIDFLNISSTSNFCSNDRLPEDYVKRMTYEKLQKDFSKEFFVEKFDYNIKSIFTSNGYYFGLNWTQPEGSSLTDITPNYSFRINIPSYEDFSEKFEADKGSGGIDLNDVTLIHGDKKYRANTRVYLYGREREPLLFARSVKELCDRNFKGVSMNSQVKYNYDQCLLYSFGYN